MKIEKYKKIKEDLYRFQFDNGTIVDIYEDVIVKNNVLYKRNRALSWRGKIRYFNSYN